MGGGGNISMESKATCNRVVTPSSPRAEMRVAPDWTSVAACARSGMSQAGITSFNSLC